MIDAVIEATFQLMNIRNIGFIIIGVLVGFCVGILPGLGGTVGLALLLPFIYGMDPYSAMALLIGMLSVTTTNDTFFSVLFGIPGSSSSQATVMDGYPMAIRGEGPRALGAAFFASMIGGIIGALVLFISIPIARPLILSFGSPELFMLSLFGISMVGIFVGKKPFIGLSTAFFGLLLGAVGGAPGAAEYRYTFDFLYLYNGIPLVTMVLGLFAIPELLQFLTSNSTISKDRKIVSTPFDGVKDALRNKWLVVRSSMIGSFFGLIPGIGGSIMDWITYGLAKQTEKDTENFGKGDVRGVIAPESATNSKDGGAMVPTLLFGIPGSGSMAVLLGGLILLGFEAGPSMVEEENLPILMLIILTLVIANVFGTLFSFLMIKPISLVTIINPNKLVPFILVIIFIGAYQASRGLGDLIVLVAIGALGWLMKKLDWSRVPLLIGFVLAPGAERYLTLSVSRFGIEWITRPIVLVIGVIILLMILSGPISRKFKKSKRKND